tara:strand:+ start:413 stop:964 length:552 start_codon:yes stop_codon:yes gene_type:complete
MTKNNGSEKFTKKYDQTSRYRNALKNIKKALASIVSCEWCRCCGDSNIMNLVLHHLGYYRDSIRYYNYKTQTPIGELQYHSSLALEVEERPSLFHVLCNSCHSKVEELLHMSEENAEHAIFEEQIRLSALTHDTGYLKYKTELEDYGRIIFTYHESRRKRMMIKEIENPNPSKRMGLDEFFWD